MIFMDSSQVIEKLENIANIDINSLKKTDGT